jgi:uncharacterized protein with HEPN domain
VTAAARDFRDYLDDILDHARKLKSFTAGLSFEDFQRDEKTQYAVMRSSARQRSVSQKNSASVTRTFPGAKWQACATF